MATPDDIRPPDAVDGAVGIFTGRTRVQGDGFIGGGYVLDRIVAGSDGAESRPTSRKATSVQARTTADVEWVAVVADTDDENAVLVEGRIYELSWGRWVEGGGAPKIPANFSFPVVEDVLETSPDRPEITRLQPTFGDWVFCYVSDMGTVQSDEYVWIFRKFTNRKS